MIFPGLLYTYTTQSSVYNARARWPQVYCEQSVIATRRNERPGSKWAVTFDERPNPLIECSFTISDAVSRRKEPRMPERYAPRRNNFAQATRRIISIHDQLAAQCLVHRSSSYNVSRSFNETRHTWKLAAFHLRHFFFVKFFLSFRATRSFC